MNTTILDKIRAEKARAESRLATMRPEVDKLESRVAELTAAERVYQEMVGWEEETPVDPSPTSPPSRPRGRPRASGVAVVSTTTQSAGAPARRGRRPRSENATLTFFEETVVKAVEASPTGLDVESAARMFDKINLVIGRAFAAGIRSGRIVKRGDRWVAAGDQPQNSSAAPELPIEREDLSEAA